jgi:hypothetical protein
MTWAGEVESMGHRRGAYIIVVGSSDGRNPRGTLRCGWKDNIKMCLLKVGWGGRNWTDLARDRNEWWAFVNVVMNFQGI